MYKEIDGHESHIIVINLIGY